MKAILFDFGGTIDTDGVHWSEKYWELYEQFKLPVQKSDFEKSFVESERQLNADPAVAQLTFYKTISKQLNIQFSVLGLHGKEAVLNSMLETCYGDVGKTISDAKIILQKLHSRYTLGVVSNFYGNLEIVCKEFGLDTFFSVFIDSTVVKLRKPDPAIFALALERLEISANNACVVGDSYERDIVPGKQLGCSTVWLKGKSWNTPPTTEAADTTILKFEEIQNIFVH